LAVASLPELVDGTLGAAQPATPSDTTINPIRHALTVCGIRVVERTDRAGSTLCITQQRAFVAAADQWRRR